MITNAKVKRGELPKSQLEIYPQKKQVFSPQQIRAIKQSSKGQLPKFLVDTQKSKTIGNNKTGAGVGSGKGELAAGFSVGGYGVRAGLSKNTKSIGAEITRGNKPSKFLYKKFGK